MFSLSRFRVRRAAEDRVGVLDEQAAEGGNVRQGGQVERTALRPYEVWAKAHSKILRGHFVNRTLFLHLWRENNN